VILEAFSKYLHESDQTLPSMEVLSRWLWEKLSMPPQCNVDQVIHCEIIICRQEPSETGEATECDIFIPQIENENDHEHEDASFVFKGNSKSGERLLNSLRTYGQSYEQQKWARWIHNIKASDFSATDARKLDDNFD
jgi:hypothetical protein